MKYNSVRFKLINIIFRLKVLIHTLGKFLICPFWNYLRHEDFHGQLEISIITTKACSANCIFCCYQFLPLEERISMSDKVFERIVEELKKVPVKRVHFTSSSGDSLVDHKFLEKVKILRNEGVPSIKLTTNGILIDRFGVDALLEYGPDIIIISTTAFDADMYKRIYRSEHFERMRSNVLGLLRNNKQRKKRRNISIFMHIDIAKEQVLAMPETMELMELADSLNICEEYADWLGLIKQSMLSGNMKIEKPKPLANRPCQIFASEPAIHPNGDIAACTCRNITNDPGMYLGNIMETGLPVALSRLKQLCVQWQKGKIPGICYRCSMYEDPAYYWPSYFKRVSMNGIMKSSLSQY